MRDLYSDDYESVATDGADRLIPEGVRRLAGAAVFLGLIAAMGLWSYRLGTRDAGLLEHPMVGPSAGGIIDVAHLVRHGSPPRTVLDAVRSVLPAVFYSSAPPVDGRVFLPNQGPR